MKRLTLRLGSPRDRREETSITSTDDSFQYREAPVPEYEDTGTTQKLLYLYFRPTSGPIHGRSLVPLIKTPLLPQSVVVIVRAGRVVVAVVVVINVVTIA